MALKIKYRLFLAMLAATGTVVVCMFMIMQWSIGRGFLRYVNTLEQQRLERLAGDLEQAYGGVMSWNFLRGNTNLWQKIITETDPRIQEIRRNLPPGENLDLPPTRYPFIFQSRVILLDGDRTLVNGPAPTDEVDFRPLHHHGKVIGYLGAIPRKKLTDALQLRFIKQQTLAMTLIASVMLLVSAGISLPLAHRLVRPIRRLAFATHRLASGEYSTRVVDDRSDELGQLGSDFNALALSLEKNERSRRQWVADISHELRTPLAVLRSEIEAIQDGVRVPSPDAIRSLHAEVMQLGRLVEDLYQLALSDVGGLDYRKREVDLGVVLALTIDSFRAKFRDKEIELEASAIGAGFPVFGDAERLHQLFANLLENSLHYTDAGGKLDIRLERRERSVVIDFRDTAPSVPEHSLDKLFERLYRVEGSRSRSSGGAGLGLAICRNIVEGHQGIISASLSPLGGLWIRVELPTAGETQ